MAFDAQAVEPAHAVVPELPPGSAFEFKPPHRRALNHISDIWGQS